jgi:hypothetical protein
MSRVLTKNLSIIPIDFSLKQDYYQYVLLKLIPNNTASKK